MDFTKYECSSAQRRLYILKQMLSNSTAYNLPYAVQIEGDLIYQKFFQALQDLVWRHEALRTAFELENEKISQVIYDSIELPIEYIVNQISSSLVS